VEFVDVPEKQAKEAESVASGIRARSAKHQFIYEQKNRLGEYLPEEKRRFQ